MQVELKFCLGNKVYFAYSQYISKCRISIWITSNAKNFIPRVSYFKDGFHYFSDDVIEFPKVQELF